jgi:hypothetical protein
LIEVELEPARSGKELAFVSWSKRFDEPIVLEDGTTFRTLQDAVRYLAKKVPKSKMNHPKVLTAAGMLTNAAERDIAWMFFARAASLIPIARTITGESGS